VKGGSQNPGGQSREVDHEQTGIRGEVVFWFIGFLGGGGVCLGLGVWCGVMILSRNKWANTGRNTIKEGKGRSVTGENDKRALAVGGHKKRICSLKIPS